MRNAAEQSARCFGRDRRVRRESRDLVLPGLREILSFDVYNTLNWLLFSSAAKSVIIYFDFTLLSSVFRG